MKIKFSDRQSFVQESKRERTKEGFLKVIGRVARSGIQEYMGYELGVEPEFKRFSVYRPPEVVLSDSVCSLYEGVDITNDHPDKFVSPENYKKVSVGCVIGKAFHDARKENFISCKMLIKDENAIRAVRTGKVRLSVGYSNNLVQRTGTTPDGEEYDFRVTEITQINHVAIVHDPRAGTDACIYDKETPMKVITIDGKSFEMEDKMADAILSKYEALQAKKDQTEKRLADSQKTVSELKSELEKAKSNEMTNEKVQKIIKDRDDILAKARLIAGENFTCDSFDSLEIKKNALAKIEVDCTDKSESYIEARFDLAFESASKNMSKDAKDSHVSFGNDLKGSIENNLKNPDDFDPTKYFIDNLHNKELKDGDH